MAPSWNLELILIDQKISRHCANLLKDFGVFTSLLVVNLFVTAVPLKKMQIWGLGLKSIKVCGVAFMPFILNEFSILIYEKRVFDIAQLNVKAMHNSLFEHEMNTENDCKSLFPKMIMLKHSL